MTDLQCCFFPAEPRSGATLVRSRYTATELGNPVLDVVLDVALITGGRIGPAAIAELRRGASTSIFSMRGATLLDTSKCTFALSSFLAAHGSRDLQQLLANFPVIWQPISEAQRDAIIQDQTAPDAIPSIDTLLVLSFLCAVDADFANPETPIERVASSDRTPSSHRSSATCERIALCGAAVIRLARLENSFSITVHRVGTPADQAPFEALLPVDRRKTNVQLAKLCNLLQRCRGAQPEAALVSLRETFSEGRWRLAARTAPLTNPILTDLKAEVDFGRMPTLSFDESMPSRPSLAGVSASRPTPTPLELLEDLLQGRERLILTVMRHAPHNLSRMDLCLDPQAKGFVTLRSGVGCTFGFRVDPSTFGGQGTFGVTDGLMTFVTEPEVLLSTLASSAEWCQEQNALYGQGHLAAFGHAARLAESFGQTARSPETSPSIFAQPVVLAPIDTDHVLLHVRNGRGLRLSIDVGPNGPEAITIERRFFGVQLAKKQWAFSFGSTVDPDFIRAFYNARLFGRSSWSFVELASSHCR